MFLRPLMTPTSLANVSVATEGTPNKDLSIWLSWLCLVVPINVNLINDGGNDDLWSELSALVSSFWSDQCHIDQGWHQTMMHCVEYPGLVLSFRSTSALSARYGTKNDEVLFVCVSFSFFPCQFDQRGKVLKGCLQFFSLFFSYWSLKKKVFWLDGGGFLFACEDFERMFDYLFSACAFFFLSFFLGSGI